MRIIDVAKFKKFHRESWSNKDAYVYLGDNGLFKLAHEKITNYDPILAISKDDLTANDWKEWEGDIKYFKFSEAMRILENGGKVWRKKYKSSFPGRYWFIKNHTLVERTECGKDVELQASDLNFITFLSEEWYEVI